MRIVIAFIELLGELNNSIGATSRRIAIVTQQIRPPQAGFAREHLDSIAAEALFDTFAVEIDRLGRTGT